MIFSPWRLSLFVLQFFPLDLMLYLCQASIIMCQSVGLFFLLPQEYDEKGTQGERERARERTSEMGDIVGRSCSDDIILYDMISSDSEIMGNLFAKRQE
jgi:hypothetical protein